MNYGTWWCVLAYAATCAAEKWQWPEQAASVRIDTKVRFIDGQDNDNREQQGSGRRAQAQADEAPFHEAAETDGFYNRPAGAGRYPVRVESYPYRVDSQSIYSLHNMGKSYNSDHDGTLDSLQYCKCETTPDCNPRRDSANACGVGQYLCCYKRPNKVTPQNSEFFNEVDEERPSLLPGREQFARPFPPPPHGAAVDGAYGPGYARDGRDGASERGVLVGPSGPTGVIGPLGSDHVVRPPKRNPDVLVGPEGPTGVIGPAPVNQNRGVIGPDGPRDVGPSESAQRGILVGPGGPTGVIGPRGYGQQRPVLIGPSGPTGIIGPRMQGYFNQFFGRGAGPGVLVGPGGPTGMIGPARRLLVGPGGPTGLIGPHSYFG